MRALLCQAFGGPETLTVGELPRALAGAGRGAARGSAPPG